MSISDRLVAFFFSPVAFWLGRIESGTHKMAPDRRVLEPAYFEGRRAAGEIGASSMDSVKVLGYRAERVTDGFPGPCGLLLAVLDELRRVEANCEVLDFETAGIESADIRRGNAFLAFRRTSRGWRFAVRHFGDGGCVVLDDAFSPFGETLSDAFGAADLPSALAGLHQPSAASFARTWRLPTAESFRKCEAADRESRLDSPSEAGTERPLVVGDRVVLSETAWVNPDLEPTGVVTATPGRSDLVVVDFDGRSVLDGARYAVLRRDLVRVPRREAA